MSNIKTRKGASLNLNTGKGIKTANLFEEGDTIESPKLSKLEGALENTGAILGGVGSIFSAYQQGANAYNTAKYDTALSQVDDSISIGNYDALADWRASMPAFNTNITAKSLDNTSTLGKIGNVIGAAGSGAATGAQVGGGWGAAIGAVVGAGAAGAGLLVGKNKREKAAAEYSLKNQQALDRINAMYSHELADIQEQNKLNAMANLVAKGGKIHIAPSKRGTFKAQAKRMGMSVQEAARHILAHKDRYSPAMRKKANFARNFAHAYGGELFDEGGPLFNFPVEYNHGGYFSLDPELIKINQGGTHEMNPLDGVPMGFDENGIPNLVEEGETIYDNYVFSNRLAPTENQLAEGGLATKYKEHTFADISAKIAKKYEETPNDEIAKESMKEDMQRLKTIQEEVKADKEAEEQINAASDFAFAPEAEQQQMLSQETPTNIPTETPTEMPTEVPTEMPQEVPVEMESMKQQPVDMMAFGGNLFEGGGDAERAREAARKVALKRAPEGTAAYEYYYKEALTRELESLKRLQNAKELREQHPELMTKHGSVPSIYPYSEEQKKKADDYLRSRGYTYASNGLDEETEQEYRKILYGKDEIETSGGGKSGGRGEVSKEDIKETKRTGLVKNPDKTIADEITARNTGGGTYTSNSTTSSSSEDKTKMKEVDIKGNEVKLKPKDVDDLTEYELRESGELSEDDLKDLEEVGYADDILKAQQKLGARRFNRKIKKGETIQDIVDAVNSKEDLRPTWMRYAPVVGAGLSAVWNAAQKPDYSVAEAVESAARNVPRARFTPIGNYLTYKPLDRNYYLNQVRNQGLATDRAILNSTGANQGAATAALLASQYNTQNNIGNSLMQQELANRQNEQQVAQFNRGTDQYNSQGLFNESIYNQRAGMQKSHMGITAAQLRQAERQRRNAAISADLTNLFQGIGDIGWENMNMNMVNTNRANIGYGIGNKGQVTYRKGGMLTKKKSRRK